MENYVIGVDYGSDSARAVVINASNGTTVATAVMNYPRWAKGLYCDASKSQYRQHPLDYIEVLESIVRESLAQCSETVRKNIVAMAFDTTGSTPCLVDASGTPLALLPEFKDNPNAMFMLWKDHTSIKEAQEINALAHQFPIDFTQYSGGIYDAEWVWAKMLHALREDARVREQAYAWIECSDWLPALMAGRTLPGDAVRNRCAAGHKAMWNAQWGGLPSEAFLTRLDPLYAGMRERLYTHTATAGDVVGTMTGEWAQRLGLPEGVVMGVGTLDCHAGAVGGGIAAHVLARTIGTSTCDILVAPQAELSGKIIPGICGQVDGSVIPDLVGIEAGQSCFGDVYAWFKNLMSWGLDEFVPDSEVFYSRILPRLEQQAKALPMESSVCALDWLNGRRSPDNNPFAKGAIAGLTLGTSAVEIYKAMVESTVMGSRAIMERIKAYDIRMDRVVALGGIARKSDFVMQTMADVMNVTIQVAKADQACAAGAAMFAAVAAGIYATVPQAQAAMCEGYDKTFVPRPDYVAYYNQAYTRYRELAQFMETQSKA